MPAAGDCLLAAELFTPAGLKALSAKTASQNVATLQKAVRTARRLAGQELGAEDRERHDIQVTLYEECAGRYKPGGYP